MTDVEKSQRNPYRDAAIWVKGEYLDLKGMQDAINSRSAVMSELIQTEKKIIADTNAMESNRAGKTTLTNFWKSKSSKETKANQLQEQIEQARSQIQGYKDLIHFLTIYHGEIAIPDFKVGKKKQYLRLMTSFCMKEVANAH